MGKSNSEEHRPFGFGNTSRRFSQYSLKREKGKIAKDRFAFEQAQKGNDCTKIRKDGDFVVQERDFFGNEIGQPKVYDVKSGNTRLTEAQAKRKRRLGRDRHKVVRY
ncbi:MAG: hypothetical protein ACBZ72_02250 [Candidatus Bathyarchaeia archaeon]|jgi:hypothetical protein